MIVITFLSLTLLLALLALQILRRSLGGQPKVSWTRLLLGLSLSAFVYLYGAWVYISAYGKFVFALSALLMICYAALRRGKSGKIHVAKERRLAQVTLAAALLTMDVLFFTGTTGTARHADLAFPLKPGRYFILQGGKGLPANVFHYNSRKAAYAIDIVELDNWGRRCRTVFSRNLSDYHIFGDTVYSPCDGVIARAVSDNPDNIPPRRKRGPHNLNGVVLAAEKYTVYMGHLQQHRVFVRAGQAVKTGQPLGLAGNSGMSLEPHLHLQVHEKSEDGRPWYRQPQLFIRFFGKEYLLFEMIDARMPR